MPEKVTEMTDNQMKEAENTANPIQLAERSCAEKAKLYEMK
jgi:hypothetical protein